VADERNTEELVSRAKNGDMAAFEELILQHEKIVYNIAYRMMNHPEDVKDISQEVFIKIHKNLNRFDGKSAFSTWIYRIAVNTCIDELRRRKGKQTVSIDEELEQESNFVKRQFVDKGETPETSYLAKEEYEEVMEAMEHISKKHKVMITLRDINGFSYEEIAEITELSMGTVKSRLARARNQLKEEFFKSKERKMKPSRQNKRKEGKPHEM